MTAVRGALSRTGFTGRRLELEITESVLRAEGCDAVRDFPLSRPMPAAELPVPIHPRNGSAPAIA